MSEPRQSLFDFGPMSSPSEVPAKICQSQGSVVALLESDRVFSSDAWSFVLRAKPNGWYSRTSLVFSVPTKGGTLPASLKRSQERLLKSRAKAGKIPALPSGRSTPLPGLCWTRNGSDWRSGASVCSLSQVLETGAIPTKYFLSPTACRGILRRAAKRGKTLPEHLRLALEQAASPALTEPAQGM
jgi:hypothetical protein